MKRGYTANLASTFYFVIASEAKQSSLYAEEWIASSLALLAMSA